jgi:hypothetical protein
VDLNPTQGVNVCVCVYSVFVHPVCRQRPCDGLITRPSSTVRVKKDYQTEEEARAQRRAVQPLMNE